MDTLKKINIRLIYNLVSSVLIKIITLKITKRRYIDYQFYFLQ